MNDIFVPILPLGFSVGVFIFLDSQLDCEPLGGRLYVILIVVSSRPGTEPVPRESLIKVFWRFFERGNSDDCS